MSDAPKTVKLVPPVLVNFYNPGIPRPETDVAPGGPSLTRQEFADECDINNLMARYENNDIGAIMRRATEPTYVDFCEMPDDLMGYMKLMSEAGNAFMTLSAQVRREFDNDPIAFTNFALDPANIDQLRDWGLAKPLPVREDLQKHPISDAAVTANGGKPAPQTTPEGKS